MLDDPLQSTLVCLVLFIIEALFTASEISIFSVSENRLTQLEKTGSNVARRIKKLQADEPLYLQRLTQFGHYLLHLTIGAVALGSWPTSLAKFILARADLSVSEQLVSFLIAIPIMLLLALLLFVLGRLVPRRWALRDPEGIAFALVRPYQALLSVLVKFGGTINAFYEKISSVLGDNGTDPVDVVTEEELKAFVTEHGTLAEDEKDMIHSVFEFGDVRVSELMTPRIDIEALPEDASMDTALALLRETGYSRVPIYQDTIDHVIGVIHLKDVLNAWLDGRKEDSVSSCLHPIIIVPEQKMGLELLHEMRNSRHQMAIVNDEFGGIVGLITMENLIEKVVGEIRDESDSDEVDEINVLSPSEVRADGLAPVHELNNELGWQLPEKKDYDTVGGLVFSHLGRIPQEGDSVEVEGYLFKVEEMEHRRIKTLHISALHAG